MIAINQDPLGRPGIRLWQRSDAEVWVRMLAQPSPAVQRCALALLNRAATPQSVTALWKDLPAVFGPRWRGSVRSVRDVWARRDLPTGDWDQHELTSFVMAHSTVLLLLEVE